ncbi:major facilitator superfamily transporter [Microdochium trichocladiopsis]|uniref:Major facilitator superfamily transporter n=1 Tax=Microdochium trichocladiopsis TaxID=1682393 RepID=A0A9P9BIY6_9PEZI|nr:major facilitator superfamily transporter [Microdochium trichocladiopsis]KAH7014086.1 major facilitator superfamily transporter [Microdochium trichocladiopsis]
MNSDQAASVASHSATPSAATWTAADEHALVRKMDLRIFPTMIVLFILNFIDRNNFANARLRGLEADLRLTDVQYQTCISILLVGYVACQVPSNMILNKLTRPSWYLCSCVVVWGIISAATAAVHDATGAILCRFFLGCVEASFFPGSIYFLSRWYTRKEMQLRVTLLNAGNLVAQAFGGLIAAGILANMEGVGGIRAWRWLFILEGAITVAIGGLAVFILPDYPRSTGWLTVGERHIAETRLALDVGVAEGAEDEEGGAFHGLKLAVMDPKVWLLGLAYHTTIMGLSFSFFFPTITQSLGYNTTTTLLLTAPPWIWACLVSLPNAWHADKTGERFFHYLGPAITCIVGYIIAMTTRSTGPRYFSMFLMTTGYASGFVMLAWISNTIPRPAAKKAAAIAMVNAMGNIGSIPGSYIYPVRWGPLYVESFGVEIGILSLACVCAFALRTYLRNLNKRLDKGELSAFEVSAHAAEHTADIEGKPPPVVLEQARQFRYLY